MDLDSLKWWGLVLHRVVTASTGVFTSIIVAIRHGPEVWDTIKGWFGVAEDIERRIGERRHMNILEIPQFIRDVVQLANDVKSAEAVLAPQYPQLLADAEKIKTDGEALLGINDIAKPMVPPPTTAS